MRSATSFSRIACGSALFLAASAACRSTSALLGADPDAQRAFGPAALAQRGDDARLELAQLGGDRKSLLLSKNFISPADRDKARTTLDGAIAQVRLTEAQVKNSESVVGQREAQVAQAKVDLGRTEIRSPVDGIVVKRSVEPGQTVAASLQAPELFVIAQNLQDMQVDAAIDESDVGRLKTGQKASFANGQRANFTVDAFPQRRFEGEVRQVRKAATVVSNVVTYTVIVTASNDDLMLLPGMTANVRIVTAKKDKVLKVANAVLRFKPESEKDAAKVSPGGTPAGGAGGPGKRGKPPSQVWALDEGGKPKAIPIETGITDGTATEITAGDVREGMEVIVGATAPAKPATPGGPRMF